jgi:hypothetical protein
MHSAQAQKAAPYLAALSPGLQQLAAFVCAVPDPEDRLTVALFVATHLLGTACGVMQEREPALAEARLSEIAESVTGQIIGMMRESEGRVN